MSEAEKQAAHDFITGNTENPWPDTPGERLFTIREEVVAGKVTKSTVIDLLKSTVISRLKFTVIGRLKSTVIGRLQCFLAGHARRAARHHPRGGGRRQGDPVLL